MRGFRTRTVHSGQKKDPLGAHTTPIYQTSTFAYGSFERGKRLFAGEESGYLYSRIGNPTVAVFEEKVADLEKTEAGLAFSSGMAAISSMILTLASSGDEIVYIGPLYGGTEAFLRDTIGKFGIKAIDAESVERLNGLITAKTRLVYMETPSNPMLNIIDIAQVAKIAHSHNTLLVVDNTFSTPYLTRPIEHGADLVVHSATKYLGGHGDVIGGIVVGPKEIVDAIRAEGLRHLGGSLGPQEAYLLLRGSKTLALRMEAHCSGAEQMARFLMEQPNVKKVYYPGLVGHPGRESALRQMYRFGGIVAFEIDGGLIAAEAFLDSLQIVTQAVSLGDVESLATHPASTTHQLLPTHLRERYGISDGLVRLSVGMEEPHDLIDDVYQALQQAMIAQGKMRLRTAF